MGYSFLNAVGTPVVVGIPMDTAGKAVVDAAGTVVGTMIAGPVFFVSWFVPFVVLMLIALALKSADKKALANRPEGGTLPRRNDS
jgi:L-lactate permease